MNFETVFKLLLRDFEKEQIRFALIGGFALACAGYPRATGDIDFLAAREDLPRVKQLMRSHGYSLLHGSQDVANFLHQDLDFGRVDFLLAHRKYAINMLLRAEEKSVLGGKFKLKVIRPEDLIGLKVQSSSNDPSRFHQDMADIESVLRANLPNLDLRLIREYFALFDRKQELSQILKKLKYAQ